MTVPKPHLISSPLLNSSVDSGSLTIDLGATEAVHSNRLVIGWREYISLPLLGIHQLDAKIDTGARSSSLDVHSIEEFRKRQECWVRFRILENIDLAMSGRVVEAKLIEYRNVRASSGHVARRPVILTELALGDLCWPVEITLSNRRSMGYRMLIGRLAIETRFLVDASRSHLLGSRLNCPVLPPLA